MREFLLTTLLLLPSALIANRSVSGGGAGYFLLYSWLAEAVVYGVFGLEYFIFGLLVLLLMALIFRKKLDMNKWWSNKLKK